TGIVSYADETETIPAETMTGECGEEASWFYVHEEEASSLVVSGTGEITGEGFEDLETESITSLTIEEGITSIGAGAFEGWTALEELALPDGLTRIDADAFKGCDSLVSVTIPDTVRRLGDHAFADCGSLGSVFVPVGVSSVGADTFEGDGIARIYFGGSEARWNRLKVAVPDTAAVIANTEIAAPVITNTENAISGITLEWTAVPAADHYRVYYREIDEDEDESPETSETSETAETAETEETAGTTEAPEVLYVDELSSDWTLAGAADDPVYTVKRLTPGGSYAFAVVSVVGEDPEAVEETDEISETDETAETAETAETEEMIETVEPSETEAAEEPVFSVLSEETSFKWVPAVYPTLTNANGGIINVAWTRVRCADEYEVSYCEADGDWVDAGTTRNAICQISGIKPGKHYDVRVRAFGDGYWSAYSEPVSTMYTDAPAEFVTNVEVSSDGYRTYSWTGSEYADGYELAYSLSSDYRNAETVLVEDGDTSAVIGPFEDSQRVYVRVRSYADDDGETCYSLWTTPGQLRLTGADEQDSGGARTGAAAAEPVETESTVTYILNTHTMRAHLPGCSHLPTVNRLDSHDSAEQLIARGYRPCGFCHPWY
ncbi:MAG: fibronectin type III domain-containing protein, partial [Lachnospiraceae bacterium]|nr:fibronectin type III domain-containing protein [Lachnospiraceae bacterium]